MKSELDKFSDTVKEREAISRFLDFLAEEEIVLCKTFDEITYDNDGNEWGERWLPIHLNKNALLAKFCDIDEAKLETERRQLLESFRNKSD